jgi:phosphatidylinositol glycan class W
LLCSLLQPLLHSVPWLHLCGVLSLVIAIAYQLCLSWMGLAEYMDKGPDGDGSRSTLFSANREGVISCAGYLAIYLGSIELGQWLFRPR